MTLLALAGWLAGWLFCHKHHNLPAIHHAYPRQHFGPSKLCPQITPSPIHDWTTPNQSLPAFPSNTCPDALILSSFSATPGPQPAVQRCLEPVTIVLPPRHHSQGCNGLQRAWGHVHVRGSAPDAGRPLYIPDPCPPHPAALLGPRSALLTTCSALDSRPPVPFYVFASPGDPSALSLISYRQPCSPQESYPKDQSRLRNL